MTRITRFNDLKESVSGGIPRTSRPPFASDSEAIEQWLKHYNEAVLEIVDSFREGQKQAFEQILGESKEYDGASLIGKLKRLVSG